MNAFTLSHQIRIIAMIAVALLGTEFINLFMADALNQFGLRPRSVTHLSGVLFAPLLHANITHFASNFLPLLMFSWLTMQWGKRVYVNTTLLIWLGAGVCVWLFGRSALHIGASGMVYGYLGFLILGGFYSKKLHLLIISIVIAVLYGGMIFGVLPLHRFVSFEYHLFGFIMGLIAARFWAKRA